MAQGYCHFFHLQIFFYSGQNDQIFRMCFVFLSLWLEKWQVVFSFFREEIAILTFSTRFEWVLYVNQGSTPEEYTTTFTYDPYGNVTSSTDPEGNTMHFGYDSHSLYLTSITNALNQTRTATRDFTTGLVTSMTDAEGNTTSFEYDILGRVTKKINPDLTEKEAVYNDSNNTIIISDELDHSTIHYYDGLGRLRKTEWGIPSCTIVSTSSSQLNILISQSPSSTTRMEIAL